MKNLLSFLARRKSQPRRFTLCCAASGSRWTFEGRTYEHLLSELLLSGVFGLTSRHAHRLAREAWERGSGGSWGDVLTMLEVR